MINIFINLKRFEVPKHLGGICPQDDPQAWIEWVIEKTLARVHGHESAVQFTFFLGEGLIHTAVNTIKQSTQSSGSSLSIGSQGVHWQDITPGGNFGAFTSLLPAKAAKEQLEIGLKSIETVGNRPEITIGYEPIWAIGPGKTPPGADYIGFVSSHIKRCVNDISGFTPSVVYGGGLKEDNAEMIAGVKTIDGGLVALTRFSGDIGFYPDDLWKIVEKYGGYSK